MSIYIYPYLYIDDHLHARKSQVCALHQIPQLREWQHALARLVRGAENVEQQALHLRRRPCRAKLSPHDFG